MVLTTAALSLGRRLWRVRVLLHVSVSIANYLLVVANQSGNLHRDGQKKKPFDVLENAAITQKAKRPQPGQEPKVASVAAPQKIATKPVEIKREDSSEKKKSKETIVERLSSLLNKTD